jgi:choice-of-anchor B domain-containing protein
MLLRIAPYQAEGGAFPMSYRVHASRVYVLAALVMLGALVVMIAVASAAPVARLGSEVALAPATLGDYPDEPSTEGPVPMSGRSGAITPCIGGMAGEYPCNGIDLYARVPFTAFTTNPTRASSIWGYTDLDDNKEYAIIGLNTGTGVVDITDAVNPVVIGTIPGPTNNWREVKVLQFYNQAASRWDAYAYISTEAGGTGIQIIDLTQLPNSVSLAGTYTGVGSVHSLFISNIDWRTNVANYPGLPPYLYLNGSNLGGLRIISLANPTNLTQAGVWTGTYAHEIYTHVFTDTRANQCQPGHNPCEVVFNFAGTPGIRVIDVTNKSAPVTIGSFTYPQLGYAHSGWISPDDQYMFLNDELDEQTFGLNTTIRTLDISNLTSLSVSNVYTGPTQAIDHVGFTLGNKYYLGNNTRGLTIYDVTDPNAPVELSFFDTYPANNNNSFNGVWGAYPYFASGSVILSDRTRNLFIVREQTGPPATFTPTPIGPTQTPTPPTPTHTPQPPGYSLYLPLVVKSP